jgi:hypothetical protein
MDTLIGLLKTFLRQAKAEDLKTAHYPKTWSGFDLKVSFGTGGLARVPWIALTAPEMRVSHGFYPVYLFYKEKGLLILSYGVSETEESAQSWPLDISSTAQTIGAYLDSDVPRYGDSYVFKAYRVEYSGDDVNLVNPDANTPVTVREMEANLDTVLGHYRDALSMPSAKAAADAAGQGIFYMEKQLEDFIIQNWDNTELGKELDLIIEDGVVVSQQYRTEVGPIDILAKDKTTGAHVVIELKKNQTSDDTVGQLARYMGWVKEKKGDDEVRGIIIAGQYDTRLDYALKIVPNAEVFIYEVSFKLREFTK